MRDPVLFRSMVTMSRFIIAFEVIYLVKRPCKMELEKGSLYINECKLHQAMTLPAR